MVEVILLNDYKGYGKCLKLTNNTLEAIVTVDLGPRIISFSRCGCDNVLFAEKKQLADFSDESFETFFGKGRVWNSFGGHRLWVSPEKVTETYYPDSSPVNYEITNNGAVFTPSPEIETGFAKQIELYFADDGLKIINRITNISTEPLEFAPWAITVMRKGGVEIIPLNTNDTGLLANRKVAIWPYADMRDERFYFGHKYATLIQNSTGSAFKIGFDNNSGTAYYHTGEYVFKKSYSPDHDKFSYPDGGVSYETYTNETIIELETLGALIVVSPQCTTEHTETWNIYKTIKTFDCRNDESINCFISSL